MNTSIMNALLWEQALRTGRVTRIAFAIMLGIAVLAAPFRGLPGDAMEVAVVLLHVMMVAYIGFMLFAYSDETDLRLALPAYLLRVPARSCTIAWCRLLYGTASVGALAFAVGFIQNIVCGIGEGTLSAAVVVAVVYVLAYAFTQAIAWTAGLAGAAAGIVAIFWGLGIIAFALSMPTNYFPFKEQVLSHSAWVPYAASVFTLLAAAMWAAVRLQRTGVVITPRFSIARPASRAQSREHGSQREFSSPARALWWFEFRQHAQPLSLGAVIFAIAWAVFYVRGYGTEWRAELTGFAGSPEPITAYLALAAESTRLGLVPACLVGGVTFFARVLRLQQGPLRTFYLHLPVSTVTLSNARLSARLAGVILALLPFVVVQAICIVHAGGIDAMFRIDPGTDTSPLATAGNLTAVVIGFAAIAWVLTWMPEVFACTMLLFAIAAIQSLASYGVDELVIHGLTSAVVLLVLGEVILAARRRGLASNRRIVASLASLTAVGIASWWVGAHTQGLYVHPGGYLDLADVPPALLVLPYFTLFGVPLTIHWARHR